MRDDYELENDFYHLWIGFRFGIHLFLWLCFWEGRVHTGNYFVSSLHHKVEFVAGPSDQVLGLLMAQVEHVLSVDFHQVISRLAARVTCNTVERNLGDYQRWDWLQGKARYMASPSCLLMRKRVAKHLILLMLSKRFVKEADVLKSEG